MRHLQVCAAIIFLLGYIAAFATAFETETLSKLESDYSRTVEPFLNQYCAKCHSGDIVEASVDLDLFASFTDVRKHLDMWQKIQDVLVAEQMPPVDSDQPLDDQRTQILEWLNAYLSFEASRFIGDPGPIVLRRLSNAEYTNSIRQITGVTSLNPGAEFPVDGASGEGFTSAGNGLVMSPILLEKYLAAGKEIATHAVLLPDGIRFSPSNSRRDWTEETIRAIRAMYSKYSIQAGTAQINLQGAIFDTHQDGRLPLEAYLRTTIEERTRLAKDANAFERIAAERSLSPKYLALLWAALQNPSSQTLRGLSDRWRTASVEDVPFLVSKIQELQSSLWTFSTVGHIGKANGPVSWMTPVNPVATRQDFRLKLPTQSSTEDVVFYLVAGTAGDGDSGDIVMWERPRLVAPGRPDILLKDAAAIADQLKLINRQLLEATPRALAAADWAMRVPRSQLDMIALSKKFECDPEAIKAWFEYLGISFEGKTQIDGHLLQTAQNVAGHEFVSGWVGEDSLSVVANASDNFVRIPGDLDGHSIAIHPSPTKSVAVGWQAPMTGSVRFAGAIRHVHPGCGNGVAWEIQLRRGQTRQILEQGVSPGPGPVEIKMQEAIAVVAGDLISIIVSPREGNHACDLTSVQMRLSELEGEQPREWNLVQELAGDLTLANPRQDRFGNPNVWHLYSEPVMRESGPTIPQGSLLAKWRASVSTQERGAIAAQLADLLLREQNGDASDADRLLVEQLSGLGGPLMAYPLTHLLTSNAAQQESLESSKTHSDKIVYGLLPDGTGADAASVYTQAPSILEVRLPASLVSGSDFVTTGLLADTGSQQGSVQLAVQLESPIGNDVQAFTAYKSPVVVSPEGTAKQRVLSNFEDFRRLFPAALCYSKIVPVDEVVTLTLHYREDEAIQRLMMTEAEIQTLNRLWNELRYVSRDAFALVDSFEQLWQYATQDGDPNELEPLRQPIVEKADALKKLLGDTEPVHVEALLHLGELAYRRPLTREEAEGLRKLYTTLRDKELDHEQAIQFIIARVFASPAFLYRMESGQGDLVELADGEISKRQLSNHELATRISYFLTSSPPDERLTSLANNGELVGSSDTIDQEAKRLLNSSHVRNLATEFGCQWLHIYDFHLHDEKSETVFPSFADLREDFYEEAILYWMELFQKDLPITNLLDSDYTFVNKELAQHYGLPDDGSRDDSTWRRVDGVRQYGRGGILVMASILSKQAGASRTSPILRGNWISEVLLGDKLPSPPLNVPVLPEALPAGLTERELIEQHSSNAACAKCHVKIDPYGFAMEGYDGIGTRRELEQHNTAAVLYDGTKVGGFEDLRTYLATIRRDAFVKQFCKKLLGYALGRAVQLSDKPLIDQMMSELAKNDYRATSAIRVILHSQQFQFVRVDSSSHQN